MDAASERTYFYQLMIGQLRSDGLFHAAQVVADASLIHADEAIRPGLLFDVLRVGLAAKDDDQKRLHALISTFKDEDLDPRSGVIDAFDLEVVVGVEEATAGLDLSKEAADPPKWPVLSTKFQSQSHRSGVTCTSFNRDGTLVLSASEDGAVKITEVNRMVNRSGDLPPALRVFQAEGNVHSLALHPFATVFAAGSRDSVAIFNYNKPDVKKPTRVLPFGFTPTSLAFHPTGDYLLAGGEPGIRLVDVNTLQVYATSSGKGDRDHSGAVTAVTYASEGGIYASAASDGTLKIWDTVTGQCHASIAAHRGPVHSVAFSRNAHYLLTAGADSLVKLWDLSTSKPLHVMVGCDLSRRPGRACFSHNEEFVLCPETSSSNMIVWSTRGGAMESRFNANHSRNLAVLAASPTQDILFTGDLSGVCKLWAPIARSAFA